MRSFYESVFLFTTHCSSPGATIAFKALFLREHSLCAPGGAERQWTARGENSGNGRTYTRRDPSDGLSFNKIVFTTCNVWKDEKEWYSYNFCNQTVSYTVQWILEGVEVVINFFKHYPCCKFKLLSTAGYSFFSKITRNTKMACFWDQLVIIQNLNDSVRGKNINNSSKQPGCDVNTRHGCCGGVRISHHCIQFIGLFGLLFHKTQPTSRSTIKAIACSKPTISEH